MQEDRKKTQTKMGRACNETTSPLATTERPAPPDALHDSEGWRFASGARHVSSVPPPVSSRPWLAGDEA